MKWKTLYKKSNTGAIIQWKIWTEGTKIITEHGQFQGKLQRTEDIIKSGKNIGRDNETTPERQAELEARSKFIKQKKRGYVVNIDDADKGKVSKLIKGGILPMLAKSYDKDKKHINFPAATQPKLDGVRCLYEGGQLWSRTRKLIPNLPHILEALKDLELEVLDGELYNHDLKEEFESIVSAVTSKNQIAENAHLIQYHIYDIPDTTKTFEERMEILEALRYLPPDSPIKLVETRMVESHEHLLEEYSNFVEDGYEGSMVRNLSAKYEQKRSAHLQKVKQFEDAEFKIVGINEGRGKLMGHAATFVLEINDEHGKRTFKAKLKGSVGFLKECFENHSLWKNKWMTVQYQGYSNKDNKPRFPVGLRLRDLDY